MNNLIVTILHLGIDGFLVTYVALKLFKVEVNLTKLFLVAGIYATLVFTVRKIYSMLGIPFGTHTLILVALLILLLRYVAKSPWVYAIPGALFSLVLIILASPIAFKLMSVANWTSQQVFANPTLLLIVGLTELTYLFLVALILKLTNFNIPAVMKIGR